MTKNSKVCWNTSWGFYPIQHKTVKFHHKWKDTYKQRGGIKINESVKSESMFSLCKETQLLLKAKLFCSISDTIGERFSYSYITDQRIIGQPVNAISPFYLWVCLFFPVAPILSWFKSRDTFEDDFHYYQLPQCWKMSFRLQWQRSIIRDWKMYKLHATLPRRVYENILLNII